MIPFSGPSFSLPGGSSKGKGDRGGADFLPTASLIQPSLCTLSQRSVLSACPLSPGDEWGVTPYLAFS